MVTFLLVTILPLSLFLYIQFTGIPISNSVAIFIAFLTIFVAIITSILVTTSISSPLSVIYHGLQAFKTKKSAAAIPDYAEDEIGKISKELNRIFQEWNQEIVSLGKRQYQQDKEFEKNEYQISIIGKNLALTKSCLQVAQNLNTTFDFQSNLKAILNEAVTTLNVQWASILLINRETHEMTVACVRGIEQSLLDDLTEDEYPSIRLKPHEGLAGYVIKEGLPLIANKGHKDPRFKSFSEFQKRDQKVASILCAPIKGKDGTVLGVINFINRISPPVFRNEDLPYAQDLCTLASLVIERNKLYKNLFKDEETGLSAYNVWKGYYQEETTRAVRYAQPLTVLTIDIDDFKNIVNETNPEFAHSVIKNFGKHIYSALRDIDIASNVQDRFYCLLPNTDSAGGIYLVGRIKELLEQESFNFQGKKYKITVSAGVASYPESTKDASQLASNATSALSSAKEQGKDRAAIFKP